MKFDKTFPFSFFLSMVFFSSPLVVLPLTQSYLLLYHTSKYCMVKLSPPPSLIPHTTPVNPTAIIMNISRRGIIIWLGVSFFSPSYFSFYSPTRISYTLLLLYSPLRGFFLQHPYSLNPRSTIHFFSQKCVKFMAKFERRIFRCWNKFFFRHLLSVETDKISFRHISATITKYQRSLRRINK